MNEDVKCFFDYVLGDYLAVLHGDKESPFDQFVAGLKKVGEAMKIDLKPFDVDGLL